MSLARAVGRNTIIQFVGKVVGTILGFLTSILILRYLHPEGNGSYTTAMAYLGFFSVIADLGLYLILIRDLNKPGADQERIVGNLLALRWVSALVILGLAAALVFAFDFSGAEKVAVLIGTLSFIAVAASQLLVGVFQSRLAMTAVTVAELIGRAVLLVATWWAVERELGLYGIMAAVVVGSIINFLIIWFSARRFIQLRLRFDWAYWRTTLHDTLPVAISIVLNLIYFRADTIILRVFQGPYDVGLYGAAYKILEILNTFPIMFVGLLLPALGAAFAANNPDRFRHIFQKGFDLLLMAAIPLVVGGAILAEPLLVFMGHREYAPAAPVLRLLLVAVGALFMGSLSGHVVTIINRQRQMVWAYLSVAVIGLVVYFSLIPRFSLYGAAVGTIATESLTAIIGYILITRVMRFRLRLAALWPTALATGVMAAALWLTRTQSLFLMLGVGVIAYSLVLFATKAVSFSLVRELLGQEPTPVARLPEE
ncbi:MAG: flippase [Candidatus Kerfeldbacteria bacterium]|nr:flippase [Candidatus Kerfeldbacteria bacterium]